MKVIFGSKVRLGIVVVIALIAAALLFHIVQVARYNSSTSADVQTVSKAFNPSQHLGKPVYSAEQIGLDDAVRVRYEKRGYRLEAVSPDQYQICAPYYQHFWSAKPLDIRCEGTLSL